MIEKEEYNEAEKIYKAIELNSSPRTRIRANAYYGLGNISEKRNDIPGAIKFTKKYIDAGDPDKDGEQRLVNLRDKLEPNTQ